MKPVPILLCCLLLASCAGLHQASFDHAFARAMIGNQKSEIFRNCNAANANYPLNGNPPIYYAASYGNEDAIDLLYNYGASLQARGKNGKSLAWAAAANGRTDTARKLVALGAGTSADLASGAAAYRQKKAADAAAAKLMADGLKWFFEALASGGGGGGSGGGWGVGNEDYARAAVRENQEAAAAGRTPPNSGYGTH